MIVDEVELAPLVHRQGRGLFVHHEHGDPLHRRLAAEKVGVGAQLYLVFMLPLGEEERAVGDDIAGIGPTRFELFDDVLSLREGHFEGRDGEKIGRRVAQLDSEGQVVECLHSDERRVGDFPIVKLLGVDDIEEDIGVFRSGLRAEQPFPGIFEVLGADFLAVAPGDVVAQMENQLLTAVEHIPGFGDNGGRLQFFVEFRQADHQIGDDVKGYVIGGQRPIQARRFGAEIDAEVIIRAALRRLLTGREEN